MDCSVSETLARLLLRLSEAGEPAVLWGRQAAPYFGREFERLLDRGVLTELAQAEEWDVCPACDCGLDARPIQTINGGAVAVCPIDHRNDRALETSDLQSFHIDPAALVREIVMASGFSNEPSEILPGLWHLGQTSARRELFMALARPTILQPGVSSKIKLLHLGTQVTLIVPALTSSERSSLVDTGFHIAFCDECIGIQGEFSMDLSKLAPAALATPRLVVMVASQGVILDGTEKHVPQQPFRLLVILAEKVTKGGGFVSGREIEAAFSGRTASDVIRELKDRLSAGASDPKRVRRLIRNRRSPAGYALALLLTEIEVKP